MAQQQRLFKVLGEGGYPIHNGVGAWPLPTQDEAGEWTAGEWREVKGELVLCRNGLHAATEKGLLDWCNGPHIYALEYDGEIVAEDEGGKVAVRKARLLFEYTNWNERTARLFACECAEDVLPIFEKHYPNDKHPRQAIEVARRYANGQATRDELDAARAAAWDAAEAAAEAAAGAAAEAAARAAAWDAARAAAWDATEEAAGEKMRTRLLALLDGVPEKAKEAR